MTAGAFDMPNISLLEVVLLGAFNPVSMVVAFLFGRKSDQAAKLLIAAFAGAAAAMVVLFLAGLLGSHHAQELGRAAVGIFIVSFVAGLFYAWIGYKLAPAPRA